MQNLRRSCESARRRCLPATCEAPRGGSIAMFDLKGRSGQGPLAHRIPLTEPAYEALRVLKPEGDFAISTTGGKKPMRVAVRCTACRVGHVAGIAFPTAEAEIRSKATVVTPA